MANDHKDKAFNINPAFVSKQKSVKPLQYYIDGIKSGDRFVLSEAITLVESQEDVRKETGVALMDHFHTMKSTSDTLRLAVTGAPGVGKSTFIEHFGKYLANQNNKVAVLAIDPSSQVHKGSILGDKTRMQHLSTHPNAFIRPASAGSMLGGVAKGTKESIFLCEAAGYKTILVETVGVGQSEYWASMMVDMTLLLIQPGAGDEIQGIKRGIMEMADVLVINKADGNQKNLAMQTAKAYESVLPLFKPRFDTLSPDIAVISAVDEIGFDELWHKINHFNQASMSAGHYSKNRIDQELFWFDQLIRDTLFDLLFKNKKLDIQLEDLKTSIASGQMASASAFHQIQKSIIAALNV